MIWEVIKKKVSPSQPGHLDVILNFVTCMFTFLPLYCWLNLCKKIKLLLLFIKKINKTIVFRVPGMQHHSPPITQTNCWFDFVPMRSWSNGGSRVVLSIFHESCGWSKETIYPYLFNKPSGILGSTLSANELVLLTNSTVHCTLWSVCLWFVYMPQPEAAVM